MNLVKATAVLGIAVLLFLMVQGIGVPPIRNAHGGPGGVPTLGDPTYDLKKLNTPRVDGFALRALAAVAATPVHRVRRRLCSQMPLPPQSTHWLRRRL